MASEGYFCPTCDFRVMQWSKIDQHFVSTSCKRYKPDQCSVAWCRSLTQFVVQPAPQRVSPVSMSPARYACPTCDSRTLDWEAMLKHLSQAGHQGCKKSQCEKLAELKPGTEEWALYKKKVQNKAHQRKQKKLMKKLIASQGFRCSTCGVFHQQYSKMKAHIRQSLNCVKRSKKWCSVYLQQKRATEPQNAPEHSSAPSQDASGDFLCDGDDDKDDYEDDDDDEGRDDYVDDDTWMRGRGDVPESYWR